MNEELFEKAPIPRAYMKLALPVVLGMVVSLVYNMVDTFFIAHTGNTNLVAGVALGTPVFTLMIAIGDIFGIGGSSIISRLFGKKFYDDGKRLSVFCFYAALLCGVFMAVILLLFEQPILNLLGADAQTVEYASQYYRFIALGAPFIIVSFTPSNLLRTEGMANESMKGTILGAVINMILDPLLISAFGFGAAGAAVATVIGNICADLYFVWVLTKKSKQLSINPKGFHISGEEIGQIFLIGIPASVTNLMQSLGIALMNRCLLAYGNDKVAAMGIVMKINMIAVLVLVGFAFGGQPLFGYNYGADNKKRLKQIMKFAYLFECGLALGLTLVLGILAKVLIGCFLKDAALVEIGTDMLRLQLSSMVFVAFILITTCIFQSTGKAFGAFLLSVSRQGVIFAAVILIASRAAGYDGVIWSQPIADMFTAVVAVILLVRWIKKELKLYEK